MEARPREHDNSNAMKARLRPKPKINESEVDVRAYTMTRIETAKNKPIDKQTVGDLLDIAMLEPDELMGS